MKENIENIDTINVGIVGHIDHGKTTLLKAITGKWADTHSEELKRGITIKLGYADAVIREENGKLTTDENSKGKPVRYATFVDAPGHEMLMATMLSGATIMDAAILVIAADEGIKPQTREHFAALRAKGVDNILVAQNKIDLVKKEEAIKNYHEIKNFLKGTFAENVPIIPISAEQKINLEKLLEVLVNFKIKEKDTKSEPIFLVVRSFDINLPGIGLSRMHGGVLGGALKKGKLKIGDIIEIKPGYSYKKQNEYVYKTIKAKIISMKKGKYDVKVAEPGGSLSLETDIDPSLTKADSLAGCVASKEGVLPEISKRIKIKFNLFDEILGDEKHEKIREIKKDENLMLSVNTSTTVGSVINVKENTMELSLKIPIVPISSDSVGIARNFNGHWRLIGFGKIVN